MTEVNHTLVLFRVLYIKDVRLDSQVRIPITGGPDINSPACNSWRERMAAHYIHSVGSGFGIRGVGDGWVYESDRVGGIPPLDLAE